MVNIEVIEHRGGWCNSSNEFENTYLQNTPQAFRNSLTRNHGIETDIRDMNGIIVISHNMPENSEVTFDRLLEEYKKHKNAGVLALNVKADGMQKEVKRLLDKHNIKNYFVFDMSIPDTLCYMRNNLNFYVRHSDYEIDPNRAIPYIYKEAKGVWLDQFNNLPETPSWITERVLKQHLNANKKIVIVSRELHFPKGLSSTNLKKIWEHYKRMCIKLKNQGFNIQHISICTDFPKEMMEFFYN